MFIFKFKKKKKKSKIKNIVNMLKYNRKLFLIVFLFILLITTTSIISLANFGGGQTENTPNLQRGLVGHWTMDENSYVEGTENLVINSNYSHRNYNQQYNCSCWGGDLATIEYFDSGGYNNLPYKKMTKTSGGTGGCYHDNHHGILIENNKIYTVSAWMKASRNVTVNGYALDLNRTADNRYRVGPNINLTTEWQKVVWQYNSGSDHAGDYRARNIIYINDDLPLEVYWSGFQVEEKPHATPYVDGTRQTRLADSTPYGNHGTSAIENSPTLGSDRFGKEGGAIEFNGSNNYEEYISFPNISFNSTDEWTVSLWVNPIIHDGWSGDFLIGNRSSGGESLIIRHSNSIQIRDANAEYKTFGSSSNLYDGNWKNITWISYGNGSISVYYNGLFLGNASNVATNLNFNNIGNAYPWGSHTSYNGFLDDVRIYNRALSSEEISLLYASYKPQLQVSSLNSGLIGHWSLNEADYNPSTNRVSDLTPYSNHGTNHGATFISDRFGNEGGSMDFNVNKYLKMSIDSINFSNNQDFTSSIWINLQGTPIDGNRMGIFGDSTYIGWGIAYDFINNNIEARVRSGDVDRNYTWGYVRSFSLLDFYDWHHIVITHNSSGNLAIYHNGQFKSGGNYIENWSQNNDVYIGHSTACGGGSCRNFIGHIDDARIYNRVLSSHEIEQLYNLYKPKITPNLQKGLVLDMPLTSIDYNSSSGITSDRSLYGNHGINHGATITYDGANFNGTSNYIDAGKKDILNIEDAITISAWVKQDNVEVKARTITAKAWTYYWLYTHTRHATFYLRTGIDNQYTSLSSESILEKDTWHHIVGTYDSSSLKMHIYVDGKLSASRDGFGIISTHSSNTQIGAYNSGGSGQFPGTIKNLRIYNRALSPEEVQLLYSRGK